MADVNLTIAADIRQLRDALAAIPGMTKGEAQRMVIALQKEYAKAEAAAKKTAGQTAKEFDRGFDAIGNSAEKLLSSLGGPFGDIGDIAFDLRGKLAGTAGAIGAAGAAAAGATAVIAGLGIAAGALASHASEAQKRLDEMGLAAHVPPEARASIEAYDTAIASLSREADLLSVTLGGPVAEAVGTLASALVGARVELDKLNDAAEPAVAVLGRMAESGRTLQRLFSLGMTERLQRGLEELVETGKEHTAVLDGETAALKKQKEINEAAYKAAMDAKAAQDRAAAEEERRTAERTKTAKSFWDVVAEGAAESNAARKEEEEAARRAEQAEKDALKAAQDRLDLERQAKAETDAQTAATRDLVRQLGELQEKIDEIKTPIRAAMEEIRRHLANAAHFAVEVTQVITDAITLMAERRMDLIRSIAAKEREAAEEAREEWRESEEEQIEALRERGKLTDRQAEKRLRQLDIEEQTRILMLAREQAERRAALMEAWRQTQSAQIAMATVESIRAGISLMSSMAYLGVAAPFAAAAISAGALATAIAGIRATPPPELPTGRTPDHRQQVAIRDDEAVLNPRATAAVVEAINGSGVARGGPTHVTLQIDGRDVARAVAPRLEGMMRLGGLGLGRRQLGGR